VSITEMSQNGDVVMHGVENIISSFSSERRHFLYPGNTMLVPGLLLK